MNILISRRKILLLVLLLITVLAKAQVGEHRNDFAVGGNAGLIMSSVGFSPKIPQAQHLGPSVGFSMRYTSEKYFNMLASVYAEVNMSQMGWKEDILDIHSEPVIGTSGEPEKYSRTLNYITVPIMAHLAWGKDPYVKGVDGKLEKINSGTQFFFRAGPQFGYLMGESTSVNFDIDNPNYTDRANDHSEQYHLAAKNKLDYGIAAGLGFEYFNKNLGHFLVEGRYYLGLGNVFSATKKDEFGKSDNMSIEIRASYLFDLIKTK